MSIKTYTLDEPQFPQNPRLHLDIPYAIKNGHILNLHIIEPATPTASNPHFPLIVFTLSKDFSHTNLEMFFSPLMQLARYGFVIALVETRYLPNTHFPEQTKDINTATRYMLNHAYQYHIDPYRYFSWGLNSGAYSSLLAAWTAHIQKFNDEDVHTQPLRFKGCISFNPLIDLTPEPESKKLQTALLKYFDTTNLAEFNLLNYVGKKKLPNNLIFQVEVAASHKTDYSKKFVNYLEKSTDLSSIYTMLAANELNDGFFTPYTIDIIVNFLKDNL